jgi:hypothetical protein
MRLVSRSFGMLAFSLVFKHIPLWLDYKLSHQKIQELALDLRERPAVMWSPWVDEPEGEVQEVWLELCWKLMARRELPGVDIPTEYLRRDVGSESEIEEAREGRSEEGDKGKDTDGEGEGKEGGVKLTAKNFVDLNGIGGMTEHRLKTGQNRFLLWRMYVEGGESGVGDFQSEKVTTKLLDR